MRAVIYEDYGQMPQVREVPQPAPPPGGVIVAVAATGVCRSDWHAWMGHEPVSLPHVPGHELVGTVVDVGAGVSRWDEGDRVTVPFACGCGKCVWCRQGEQQVCPRQTQPGFTGWGSFAQYVALHAADTNLVEVPESLSDVAAAALGCRFATAYRAVTTHGWLRAGQWLVVVGVGGLGLSAVAIATAFGARVIAVDVSPRSLSMAATLGAERTVLCADSMSSETVAERVRVLTDGGAHVGIDAIGLPGAARTSVLSLRRRGRHVQAGLLLADDATTALPMDRIIAHELSVHGTHGLAAHEYPAMLDLVAARIDLSTLIGRTISLEDVPEALSSMSEPASSAGLTVVDMSR
ncbi:alcohol dehydrogenase [Kineosphaera limosa]|uniref:Alcohol dehydrogenase n=1 Tax=Kineosphaera limosa NBRC 100340 TaxID=1184609 RepID=K6VLD9_9MICO|nr:zinc-dependent alcohol dehydrogenase family protein [Kineosphaera limosa]NYD99312.1 alcohol dehydrogenase [Kineosphaera limosa]GAB97038.1 alcohol dehydrogenase [Kineosphaera limosa NBRC 100340]